MTVRTHHHHQHPVPTARVSTLCVRGDHAGTRLPCRVRDCGCWCHGAGQRADLVDNWEHVRTAWAWTVVADATDLAGTGRGLVTAGRAA